jgi:hypothetical protein
MAKTSELLNWIELECHGWQREGIRGTRALFNEAHKMLRMRQCEQNIVYDSTTGDFPYINTTSGVYKYTLPTTVWLPQEILVDNVSSLNLITINWKIEEVERAGKKYYRIRNIRSMPWSQIEAAWVQFAGVDPGTTTEVYRIRAYGKPTEITSDAVQHNMPGATDMKYLLPATVMLIQTCTNHEKFLEARRYVVDVLAPQFWAEFGIGEQGISSVVTSRPF